MVVAMLIVGLLWFLLGTTSGSLLAKRAVAVEPHQIPFHASLLSEVEPEAAELSVTEHTMGESEQTAQSEPVELMPHHQRTESTIDGIAVHDSTVNTRPVEPKPADVASTVSVASADSLSDLTVFNQQAQAPSHRLTQSDVRSTRDRNDARPLTQSASSLRVERITLTHQQQVSQLQQQAIDAEQRGGIEQARQKWQQLIALEPAMPEAYLALAHAAQRRANEVGVQHWLQMALKQGIESTEVRQQLAASFARQQLWIEALQQLAPMNDIVMSLESRALQATAWQQLGQHTQALQGFEWLAQQQPQQARWLLGMALSHDALGQSEQAVELFTRSLQLDKNLNPATITYIQQRIQDLN